MRDLSNLDRILSTASDTLNKKKPVFLALSESNSDSCESLVSPKGLEIKINNRNNIRIEQNQRREVHKKVSNMMVAS